MTYIPKERRSILSSEARIQAPWIKVVIGKYTFGVFSKSQGSSKTDNGFYSSYNAYNVQFPNYVKSLTIQKINGQVNQYTLNIVYPVRVGDDPNFFEKVFSSVSKSRKIVFTYGDAAMPSYIYKDEEAIITKVSSSFGFGAGGSSNSVINYTVSAVSTATLGKTGSYTFMGGHIKPSEKIKDMFRNTNYGLQSLFTGMRESNLADLIAGDDMEVDVETKMNTTPLDYITYLVSCMIPSGSTAGARSKSIYILTIHDDTIYDQLYGNESLGGPYFKVTKISYDKKYTDAYEVDIGYNTNTIVTNFGINQNENYSILYDYQSELHPEEYVRRINDQGKLEDIFAPSFTSNNEHRITRPEDITWYTKLTKYPISGSITIQGLLRPAMLMTYLRLNVIFPGARKHISSGLYIVTSQQDQIDESGYRTTLGITRIDGDDTLET